MQTPLIVKELYLDQLRPGQYQPRQSFDPDKLVELARSIQADDLIDLPAVYLNDQGYYEIDAGERRWRACLMLALVERTEAAADLHEAAGLLERSAADWDKFFRGRPELASVTIPVRELPTETAGRQRKALISNLQREDLSRLDEAQALDALRSAEGLSIRQLAEAVGKSKSYVEDGLKLLDLDPGVAARIEVEGGLDFSLARELARKIPTEMQVYLTEVLEKRAAKGEDIKSLKKFLANVARFIDPNRWSLSHDPDAPYHPAIFNRARVIRMVIERAEPKPLVQALINLAGNNARAGYYHDYLSRKASDIIQDRWTFSSVIKTITGDTDWKWRDFGFACETCALANLVGGIEHRVEDFDRYDAPCGRFREPAAAACETYIGPDDPQVIPLHYGINQVIPEGSGDRALIKTPMQGHEGGYVETWTDYHHLYHVARHALAAQETEREQAAKETHFEVMALYWQMQDPETTPFDLAHFQAHACRKCKYFTGGTSVGVDIPCQFAGRPLKHGGQTRAPEYHIWVAQDGTKAPRCEKFVYRERPGVQGTLDAGFVIPDRGLILEWYALLTRNAGGYGVKKPLAWLDGSGHLEKLWSDVDNDDVMMTLLQTGIREAIEPKGIGWDHATLMLPDPTTGRSTEWAVLDWAEWLGKRQPWRWPKAWGDAPVWGR